MSQRILERLNLLETYVRRFEAQADADLDDPVQRAAFERFLQLACEACLDAGEMLIAEEGLPKPGTYREVVTTLVEEGALDKDLGATLEEAAGLRNVLVHDYAEIDVEQLRAWGRRGDVFREYVKQVAAWLEG